VHGGVLHPLRPSTKLRRSIRPKHTLPIPQQPLNLPILPLITRQLTLPLRAQGLLGITLLPLLPLPLRLPILLLLLLLLLLLILLLPLLLLLILILIPLLPIMHLRTLQLLLALTPLRKDPSPIRIRMDSILLLYLPRTKHFLLPVHIKIPSLLLLLSALPPPPPPPRLPRLPLFLLLLLRLLILQLLLLF